MIVASLSNLVVEVLHNRGDDNNPNWSVGSGFFIGARLVLTALHNVDDPGELLVRLHGIEEHPAIVLLRGDKDIVDLAVLEVSDVAVNVPLLRYGAVDRSVAAVVEQCWAIGFPRFKEQAGVRKPRRLSAQINGEIPTSENLGQPLLTLRVRSPQPLSRSTIYESIWQGMDGAVVFSGENIIVGVITEHHLPEGENALTVVPITALDLLAQAEATRWWELLGVDHQALVRLPGGRPSSLSQMRRAGGAGWTRGKELAIEKSLLIFCCYARADQMHLLELKKRLIPLQREGLITIQADIDISPGEEWGQKIHHYLNTAHIILLLISPDFMASEYCYSNEMMQALKRHDEGNTHVIPVILRPVDLRYAPFSKIQSLPADAKPITKWADQDDAFLSVTNGIRMIIEKLLNPSAF